MKKNIIMLLALAVTMNVMAVTYSAKAKIELRSADNQTCTITIGQSESLSEGPASGSALINMEGRQVALYAIYGANKYQLYATKNLGALPFGIMTNASTSYTMTVSNVVGTETLQMKDEVTGTVFDLTEGYVYNFTADANQAAITDRFHLYVAPSVPGICHRYGKLQVSGSNGQNVVVKNMDDSATSIGTVAITADYQEIAVEGVLAAGQYKVEWNSQTLIIDVK